MIDVVLNQLIRPAYLEAERAEATLPSGLAAIAESGLVVEDDLLLLRLHHQRLLTSPGTTPWDHERWVNSMGLEAMLPATDPAWRPQIVRNGLDLAQALLSEALSLVAAPVQVTLAIQSAPTTVDPDIDFATGSLHLHVLRTADDDARPDLDTYEQPVLILTARAGEQRR